MGMWVVSIVNGLPFINHYRAKWKRSVIVMKLLGLLDLKRESQGQGRMKERVDIVTDVGSLVIIEYFE